MNIRACFIMSRCSQRRCKRCSAQYFVPSQCFVYKQNMFHTFIQRNIVSACQHIFLLGRTNEWSRTLRAPFFICCCCFSTKLFSNAICSRYSLLSYSHFASVLSFFYVCQSTQQTGLVGAKRENWRWSHNANVGWCSVTVQMPLSSSYYLWKQAEIGVNFCQHGDEHKGQLLFRCSLFWQSMNFVVLEGQPFIHSSLEEYSGAYT